MRAHALKLNSNAPLNPKFIIYNSNILIIQNS